MVVVELVVGGCVRVAVGIGARVGVCFTLAYWSLVPVGVGAALVLVCVSVVLCRCWH